MKHLLVPVLLLVAVLVLSGCAMFQDTRWGATASVSRSDVSGYDDGNTVTVAVGVTTGPGFVTPPSTTIVPVQINNAVSQSQNQTVPGHVHDSHCHPNWHPGHGWKWKCKDKDD